MLPESWMALIARRRLEMRKSNPGHALGSLVDPVQVGMVDMGRIGMRGFGSWALLSAAGLAALTVAAPSSAQTIDFESQVYPADKTFIGADQWTQPIDIANPADNFKIQAGPAGKWAHILTTGTTTAARPFATVNGILDLRWKWRALSDTAHFCLGASGASLTARTGNRGLACMEPSGSFSVLGAGTVPTASGETWKTGVWYYMRMALDNSQGSNKFALYVSEDSLRGAERLALPAVSMGGSGAFTRLVLRGENGSGFVDLDDISWDATAVWQGGTDADSAWTSNNNWSDNNVPDSLTHVIFPAGAGGCFLDKNATVKSITVASAYKGSLNLGEQTLSVIGKADFTGGNYPFTGTGHIRFYSARGNSLTGPEAGKTLAPVRHDGPGVLRLDGRALFTAGLTQIQGGFDFNGFDMTVIGDLTIKNGQPNTLRGLDGRAISVGHATRLDGTSKDTLLGLFSTPKGFILGGSVVDSVQVKFANLGNSHTSGATGFAYQSVDAGGNVGWVFVGPPSVVSQPKDTTVKVGENGFFKVSVSNKAGVAYQWLRDDKDIPGPGSTDSIYILTGVKKADSGAAFSCRLTNATGTTFTNTAKLRVTFPAPSVTPAPQAVIDSLSLKMTSSVPGAKVFYSRNGAAYLEFSGSLVIRDSSLIRAFSTVAGDTSAAIVWNFPKPSLPQLPEPGLDPEPFTFNDSVRVTMTPPVPGAAVYYTLDETVPDSGKLLYGAPFTLKTTTTVSAIAYKQGFRPSPVRTHIYIHREMQTIPPPTAAPAGGSFTDSIVVRLTPPAEAPQASIYYMVGALGPYKYQDSLVLRQTTTLKALAIFGSQYSDTARWEFKRRLEAPTAAPKSRGFSDTLRVTLLSKTSDAAIHYTLDGSDPTPASAAYPGQGLLLDSTTLVKAVAVKGTDVSSILSETYTLTPDTPSASPRGGDYSSLINVQLTSRAARAVIYYTLDGTSPGPERGLPPYTVPFRLDTSATLKAVAITGTGANARRSPVLVENYTFIRPGPRILGPGQRIDLSSNYSLVSPLPGASPVDVEVIAVDSMKTLKGFRDILFGIRLSLPEGASAFPKVVFNAPGGETRSLYALNPSGSARYLTGNDTSDLPAPGTYFMAVDTLAPVITYSGETFTPEDSTRLVVSIQDNVSNLLLDLDRSDLKSASFTGREITNAMLLTMSLKNSGNSLLPLTIRLKVDDHSRKTSFPADGSVYPLAQRYTIPVRTPAAFHIGGSAADPWDLIAIPLAMEPPLTLAQLRRNNSAPEMEGVTVNPATGKYRYLGEGEPLLPGSAVWVAAASSLPSLAFPALQTAGHHGSGGYQLTLHNGWNLVANPTLGTLYWPVTRAFPEVYDGSLLKGLHTWDPGTRQYVPSETLEPWRGYFAFYKGSRDTVVDLRSLPVPAPVLAHPDGASPKSAASASAGFSFRLNLAGGPSLRLGASSRAGNGIGVEDEPQPVSPMDNGPRLFSARENLRLETDVARWAPGNLYTWKIVAGLPAVPDAAASLSAAPLLAARFLTAQVEGMALPDGYAAWAVSRKRGLRFLLGAGAGVAPAPVAGLPLYPGFTDSLEVLVGPAAELEARLAEVPKTVQAFSAKVSAGAGRFALDLKLPQAARLRMALWSLDGRALEKDALDLPEGIYHLVRDHGGRGYPTGMYVLALEWTGGGAPRRLSLKIAIP
ncbi:MAG: hypothetical protein JWO30_1579 [Fibrobacteres bacterium]|nr:hypothetical protein [Fibrobacterota bacterium]